ncbi:MAG: hypothetical protein Q9182_003260 [Xanthomendoza sp. 2 TL-2023]
MPRPHGAQLAGISMALHGTPPADARPGSRHAPWMRLTAWEMAVLRTRVSKTAIWPPSEAIIQHELAAAGRGPENYRIAKAKSEATGEPFLDDDNLGEPGQNSAGSGSVRRTQVPVSPDALKDSHQGSDGKAQFDSHKVIDTKVNTDNAAAHTERTSLQDRLVQAELKLQMLMDQYEGNDQGKRVGREERQGHPKSLNQKKWQTAEEGWIMVEDLDPFVIVSNKTTRQKTD